MSKPKFDPILARLALLAPSGPDDPHLMLRQTMAKSATEIVSILRSYDGVDIGRLIAYLDATLHAQQIAIVAIELSKH
jgi:hypothetical protein